MNKIFQRAIVIIFLPIILTYVLDAWKNRLIEKVLLSTANLFWLRNKNLFFVTHSLLKA